MSQRRSKVKRALFIVIPVLVALASVVAVTAATLAFPTAAQSVLDEYLHFISTSSPPTHLIGVKTRVRANRPWNLNQDLDYPVFGTSWHYQTDQRLDWQPLALETAEWQLTVVQEGDARLAPDRRLPLPFPPQELWCVLLESGSRDQVIFLARHHREPYYTEWVVHQGPKAPFSQSLLDTLSDIGCNLNP
jgi:hypothetical protein